MSSFASALIRSLVGSAVHITESIVEAIRPTAAGKISEAVEDALVSRTKCIEHDGVRLLFHVPNWTTTYRVREFSSKEPATLKWIDGFGTGETLLDIGANIGSYSLYAAERHPDLRIVAVEPNPLNLSILVRNIVANKLGDRILVVPIALTDRAGAQNFSTNEMEPGGAHSAFGVDYGADGKPRTFAYSYRLIGSTVDGMIREFGLSVPTHVKIDVDGIEHLILAGAVETLASKNLKSVLIETNRSFPEHRERIHAALASAGLALDQTQSVALLMDGSDVWNEVWTRRE
jgi:FkbM family methyltransferase